MLLIGLDDTDTLETRGTGHLARMIATELATDFRIAGVVRQQLLVDQRVPCTKNNSCATILVDQDTDPVWIFERVRTLMLADFKPGSDPGLCVAAVVPPEVVAFGKQAQRELVSQSSARQLAERTGLLLEGLGGTSDGVIGALAAVGLSSTGEDGRYVMVGSLRQLEGLQPLETILASGVAAIRTEDGQVVDHGQVNAYKLRPARRGGVPVAVVAWRENCWQPVKLD
jgi:tRNA(Ile2) C34 agmatinyltransferase TiaS